MYRRKKFLVIGILIIFLLAFFTDNNRIMVKETINEEDYYINEIDGYGYKVPDGYYIDEEFLPYAVRFVSNDCTIEIYTEDCIGEEILSYVNYTNRAVISNEVDYFDVKQIKEGNITILSWNRKKLSKVENDKNYYLKIDVPNHTKVYTILIKSTYKIDNHQEYISAFTIIKPIKGEERVHNIKYASNREFNEVYDSTQVRGFLNKAYSENRVVELTLQPKKSHQQGNDLFRVLDGYYDEFLHNYAKDIADFKHPVLFRFANEMNGDWCEYSGYHMSLDTELYREMYRHIYDIFQRRNSTKRRFSGQYFLIWLWRKVHCFRFVFLLDVRTNAKCLTASETQ